jgi:hypothetical protein
MKGVTQCAVMVPSTSGEAGKFAERVLADWKRPAQIDAGPRLHGDTREPDGDVRRFEGRDRVHLRAVADRAVAVRPIGVICQLGNCNV